MTDNNVPELFALDDNPGNADELVGDEVKPDFDPKEAKNG